MPHQDSFSSRYGYNTPDKEIAIREDAPGALRFHIVETARELNFGLMEMRSTLCKICHQTPILNNWGDGNIWKEVQDLINDCDWFRVYDAIEAFYTSMERTGRDVREFEASLNKFFTEEGIGWQLIKGLVVTRGDKIFENVVRRAQSNLIESNRPTAYKHLSESLLCLSRRPEPNSSGAVYHAMGSLECVARDATGDAKATLGDILKRYPGLLPRPLDTALSQIWGYSSNEARHVEEGREVGRDEAELIVGLCATIANYLTRKGNS